MESKITFGSPTPRDCLYRQWTHTALYTLSHVIHTICSFLPSVTQKGLNKQKPFYILQSLFQSHPCQCDHPQQCHPTQLTPTTHSKRLTQRHTSKYVHIEANSFGLKKTRLLATTSLETLNCLPSVICDMIREDSLSTCAKREEMMMIYED